MLVILDESLASELEQTGPCSNEVLSSLTICAQGVREGLHVLFADRVVYRRLRPYHDQLDKRTVAVLLRAEERLSQLGSLRDFVERAVRVAVVPPPAAAHQIINGKRTETVVPVTMIDQHSSLLSAPPALMVENLNDGHCYLKIAQSAVESGRFPELAWLRAVPLKCDIQPGGGNTLSALFSHNKAQARRIGLAIADSDIRYPGGTYGETAAALQQAANLPPPTALLEYYVLEARTIENCIPRTELRTIASQMDPVQLYRFERQEAVFGASPFWKFFPIKKGIRCYEVGRQSAESQFWTALLGDRTCLPAHHCANKSSCSTYKIPPISDQVLARSVSKSGVLAVTDKCIDGMADIWRSLIVLLYSLFCGAERVTVL